MPVSKVPPEVVWEGDILYAQLESLARVGPHQHPRILGFEYRKGHEERGPLYRRVAYMGHASGDASFDQMYGATSGVPGSPDVPVVKPEVVAAYTLTAEQLSVLGAVGEKMVADGLVVVSAAAAPAGAEAEAESEVEEPAEATLAEAEETLARETLKAGLKSGPGRPKKNKL